MHSFIKWFYRRKARAELEQAQKDEESEAKIRSLEQELAKVLEERRQQALADEAAKREQERLQNQEREDALRSQLADLTNLAVEQRNEFARERALMDERWAQEEDRRKQKDARLQEIYGMVAKIVEDRESDRFKTEEERSSGADKPGTFTQLVSRKLHSLTFSKGTGRVLEELAKLSEEQRVLVKRLFDGE